MDTKLTPRKRKFIFLLVGQKRLDFYLVPPPPHHHHTTHYTLHRSIILTRRKSYIHLHPASVRFLIFFKVFLSDHPEIIRAHTSCGRAKVNNRRARACSIPLHGPAHALHTVCAHTSCIVLSSNGFLFFEKFLPERKNIFFKYSAQ